MPEKKKEHPLIKSRLHPRNKHRERYDFALLIETLPELASFVTRNVYDDESIDFANPEAVKMLNKALLKHYYDLDYWDIPQDFLCPPIPGRADYIHHIADLLQRKNYGKSPVGENIKCFDVGVGANCVYPIIGIKEYGWSFIGSDIDTISLSSAKKIVNANPILTGKVELRLQTNSKETFYGVMFKDEPIDLSICNPPFHASVTEAKAGTMRKLKNLNLPETEIPVKNFGGKNGELWCPGGEEKFIVNMIRQSRQFSDSCFWFSTLVAKQNHLKSAYEALKKADAVEVQTIPMGQGNKISRVLAWTFLNPAKQEEWMAKRWR
ncbi:MAG: 23S rRNA (adenine(1618)-N(6))-methyltransferase RlmF [Bacteroidetes bacterium HGW-Bacteroidetes-11]|jgi:23S rRNA (adenine1618-N6)-methyltransferase|nr:MAG: 23S rRNA (adenine(1618)-N(6))-methyltransferase RlmF [Bacteroidetes bacterium HGW-Bacteroidetes-11]